MRYAVYFAPLPDTPLADAGATWLGRDAFSGRDLAQPELPGISAERFRAITADPRRYGFHATLKPPFALAGGTGEASLVAAFRAFAADRPSIALPLKVDRLGGFVALVPGASSADIEAFAADCVRTFEPFRAPLSAVEIERRRRGGLTASEDANLLDWGYPYVFGDFRFHMTLSCRLEDEADRVEAAARRFFEGALAAPVAIDTAALFVQPEPGAPFAVLTSAALQPR